MNHIKTDKREKKLKCALNFVQYRINYLPNATQKKKQ